MKFIGLFLIFYFIATYSQANTSVGKKLLNPENLKYQKDIYLPKLFDVESDSGIQGDGKNLSPNRVYLVYNSIQKGWLFSITDSYGNFSTPKEYLHHNTILRGKYLGAKKNPYQNYKLSSDWKWKPTNQDEEYFLWVFSEPQILKRVSFIYPDPWKNK